jgi:glycosyltransferase involved in cell wall biosynthesis
MAVGLPVVATAAAISGIRCESGRHYVRSERDSFVPTALALLNDPQKLRTVGLEARSLVEQAHSWPAMAERYLTMYEQLSK